MKKIIASSVLVCAVMMAACRQQEKSTSNDALQNQKVALKNVSVDNSNDLVCGMTLTQGIGDTAHYGGKVYGFCSKGCKDKFLQNPTGYVTVQ